MADEKDKKKEAEKKGDKDEAPQAAAPAPASKKKMFLIGGGVVALLLVIGVPVMIFSMKPKASEENAELAANAAHDAGPGMVAEGSHDEEELADGEEAVGAFFPFENFIVNLSGGRYVRAQVQVEFNGKDVPKRFYARLVPVRDSIISMLSSRASDDLLTDKGKDALRNDIKDMINDLLKKEEVKKVYFTQFFIQ
ncbi:MAG: flagellar basal body-associated FliL family protein [Deltaproteobacteria bacterium]|nr:flagellar basal body-associated FliL family protein [Deltaproteobacteria bacterium]